MDVQFGFAMSGDNAVAASDVRLRKNDYPQGFCCIDCEQPLIARTDGKFRQPHFAHAQASNCRGESYLHKLAKIRFVQVFDECKERGLAFTLTNWHESRCEGFNNPFFPNQCVIEALRDFSTRPFVAVERNLAARYRVVGVEKRAGNFRSDVLLQHEQVADDQILIEFAVSHECTEAKKESGSQIIEIAIADESSLELIESRAWTSQHPDPHNFDEVASDNVGAYGFTNEPRLGEPQCCGCDDDQFRLVILYKSGRTFAEQGSVMELADVMVANIDVIQSWRLYFPSTVSHRY